MTATTATTAPTPGRAAPVADRLAGLLTDYLGGPLPVRLEGWDGSVAGPADAPVVRLRGPEALRRILWHPGELGAAQAYVTGELDVVGDLGAALDHVRGEAARRGLATRRPTAGTVLRLVRLLRDLGAFGPPLPPPASQARVTGRLHSLVRDRRSISHHYDLSNDFYALVLDPAMAYSCGYWTADDPSCTLADAQRDKLHLVCRKLGLEPGMRMLDVGCGWGSLSLFAAEEYGVRVLGVTLSAEQKKYVDQRITERGLADRVEIRLQDYRQLTDRDFDAVASLEMGEHVGQRNYPVYAGVLTRAVRPGGRVLVQQMSRRGRHPGGGPFIESFIAPDMHMRPVGETVELLEGAGLEVRAVQSLREHYVRTAEAWLARLEERREEIVAMVGEEVFRVWRLYMVGGARAFRDGRMGVDQVLCARPGAMPGSR